MTMTIIGWNATSGGAPGGRRPPRLTSPGESDGLRATMENLDEFERLVATVVTRFFGQKLDAPPPAAEVARLVAQMRQLVEERGLPPPLPLHENGAPGGMSEEACAPLVARVIAGTQEPLLAEAARQLIKACFYPEFKVCRDSFREVTRDGTCRRQELERVRGRLSGSHCVDCPHWVALTAPQHAQYLRQEWRGDPAVFAAHQEIFLPEDFRALRRWLHAAARDR